MLKNQCTLWFKKVNLSLNCNARSYSLWSCFEFHQIKVVSKFIKLKLFATQNWDGIWHQLNDVVAFDRRLNRDTFLLGSRHTNLLANLIWHWLLNNFGHLVAHFFGDACTFLRCQNFLDTFRTHFLGHLLALLPGHLVADIFKNSLALSFNLAAALWCDETLFLNLLAIGSHWFRAHWPSVVLTLFLVNKLRHCLDHRLAILQQNDFDVFWCRHLLKTYQGPIL